MKLVLPRRGVFFLAIVLASTAVWAGIEEPAFVLLERDGRFERRSYPALKAVETKMGGGKDEADGSFMRLFRYIDGANEPQQKIAMTAPVLMERGGDGGKMAFLLPKAVAEAGVPKPKAEGLRVVDIAGGEFATFRFAGGRTPRNEEVAAGRLRGWIEIKGRKTEGPPVFAYYDPPWVPLVFRRNEVMLRLAPAAAPAK